MTLNNIDTLLRPIPDQGLSLSRKDGYREHPISFNGKHNHESLVNIAAYGIAGQSYYSRPNAATGDAVPQVSPIVYVREGIAERLARINDALRSSEEIALLLGGKVELYVEEGLRSQHTQRLLHDDVFPRLIRTQFPNMSEQEVLKRRDSMIAKPGRLEHSPSPHSTGAALDVTMRYVQMVKSYVPGSEIFVGHAAADMSEAARPDFFEQGDPLSKRHQLAQRNRRLFYWVMSGALCDKDSGFCVNPTEWWHWSYGDQMWAAITNAPCAFYAAAKDTAPPTSSSI